MTPPPLSRKQALTNTANAAIGTYSSTIPLYYADIQTLVERMGELRLGIQAAPAPAPPGPPEAGKGVVESKQVESKQVAPPPPASSEWAVWVRIRQRDADRRFDQNIGWFQNRADKRFGSLWRRDVNLGVFGG